MERLQKAYIAYHGTSPWSPENLWGPDDDSSSESESSDSEAEVEDLIVQERYFPESLEDNDIVRAM